MIQQVILVAIFIGLMALVSLSVGLLLASLVQLFMFGTDKLISRCTEMLSEIDDKLGDDKNE